MENIYDAYENLKKKGAQFVPGTVSDWMDNGNKEVTVETNRKVLEYEYAAGNNLVSDTLVLQQSEIIPPCYIGKGVKLTNAKIGPYVSIGDNTEVHDATITNSLIQKNTKISHAVLDKAMIGNNVVFNGNFTEVSLGDFSKLV